MHRGHDVVGVGVGRWDAELQLAVQVVHLDFVLGIVLGEMADRDDVLGGDLVELVQPDIIDLRIEKEGKVQPRLAERVDRKASVFDAEMPDFQGDSGPALGSVAALLFDFVGEPEQVLPEKEIRPDESMLRM